MRETIQVDQIRCERCITKLAAALAPLKGLTEARVEMGTSSVVVEYDPSMREALDSALTAAGFEIVQRRVLSPAGGANPS